MGTPLGKTNQISCIPNEWEFLIICYFYTSLPLCRWHICHCAIATEMLVMAQHKAVAASKLIDNHPTPLSTTANCRELKLQIRSAAARRWAQSSSDAPGYNHETASGNKLKAAELQVSIKAPLGHKKKKKKKKNLFYGRKDLSSRIGRSGIFFLLVAKMTLKTQNSF